MDPESDIYLEGRMIQGNPFGQIFQRGLMHYIDKYGGGTVSAVSGRGYKP